MSGLCAGFNDRLETLAKLILLHMGPGQWVPLPSSRVLCTTRQLPWGILWLSITLSGIYSVRDSQWVGAGSASSPTSSDHCSHFQQLFLNCVCGKWKGGGGGIRGSGALFVRTAINVLFIFAKAVHSEANGQTYTLPDWLWQQTCFSSRPSILSLCLSLWSSLRKLEAWTLAHASGPEGFSH